MISGQQALRSIDQAAAQIRGQEQQLDAALRSAGDDLVRLRAERVATLKQLATVRLDALKGERVVWDLDVAERRALQLLADDQQAGLALSQRLAEAQAAREKAEALRIGQADALAQALSALEEFQAKVEPGIKASVAWVSRKAAIDHAEAVAAKADSKADLAEADRDAKRKPYESDPLFMYLWNRKFGTSDYRSGGLVRFFDRKVGGLVGFANARPNYQMLNEIPARLREHAERCVAAVAAEREQLVAVEAAGLKSAGSGPHEEKVAAGRAALADAEAKLAAADKALGELDREREAALSGRAKGAFDEAVEMLAEADGNEDIRELFREASQTRTGEDDALVRRIEAIDARNGQAEQAVAQLRQDAGTLARRRVEVEQQRETFRRQGYDSPYGQFGNDQLIGQVLGGIVKGAIEGAVLGGVLRDGYRERPRRADSSFGGNGGFSFPFPGGGGGGGGNWGGGGGSSSGGGRDGFTTGGQF